MIDTKIIIDHGSYYIKYGYSGYNKPFDKIRSKLYRHNITKTLFTHDDIIKENIKTSDLTVFSVIKNSIIIDFEKITYFWDMIFNNLEAETSNCEILIINPIYVASDYQNKISKILNEKYNFKKIHFYNQQLLGLYGSCSDKGIVIDIGHDFTRIVPIFDSFIITEGIVLFSICRSLYNKFLLKATSPGTSYSQKDITFQNMLFNPQDFDIQDINLFDAILKCIKSCPIDLRKRLCQNIVVIGGGSMGLNTKNSNFCDKLKSGIKDFQINITFPNNRNVISWLGGSMLCAVRSSI